MKLRDHPMMKWRHVRNWPPPAWASSASKLLVPDRHVQQAKLKRVERRTGVKSLPAHLYLTVEFEGLEYRAALLINDRDFIPPLYEKLKACYGQTIQQIGDMEIDF